MKSADTHFHHQTHYAGQPHESAPHLAARVILAIAIAAAAWYLIMLYIVN